LLKAVMQRRESWLAALLAAAALAGASCGGSPESSPAHADGVAPQSQGERGVSDAHGREPIADPPRSVRIPSIGVEAPVIDLGKNPDGTLEVPEKFSEAGWWSGGAAPGERGPAVIVGHVDSYNGPAVFYGLGDLASGDVIEVADEDGDTVRFAVDRLEQVPKDAFPTDAVYGDTSKPELRLITCSGDFDQSSGHYLDNTIVFASLSGT
jgi:Sortase domain